MVLLAISEEAGLFVWTETKIHNSRNILTVCTTYLHASKLQYLFQNHSIILFQTVRVFWLTKAMDTLTEQYSVADILPLDEWDSYNDARFVWDIQAAFHIPLCGLLSNHVSRCLVRGALWDNLHELTLNAMLWVSWLLFSILIFYLG